MSGWQLGLALLGCFLLGTACGAVGLVMYGRRLMRRKLEGFLVMAARTPEEQARHDAIMGPRPNPLVDE